MFAEADRPKITLRRRQIPKISDEGKVITVQTRRVRRVSSIKLTEFIVFIENDKDDLPDHFEILVDYGQKSFQYNGLTYRGNVCRIRTSTVSMNEWVGQRGELWIAASMPAEKWHKVIRGTIIKH